MLNNTLSIILVVVLILSTFITVKRRRKAGVTGIKSALSSICLYLIAVTNLLAYWFHFLGIISFGITIILLIIGAYFTRYIPLPEAK